MADPRGGALDTVFEPPAGFHARFGWVCGMSADGPFMERAVDRFSRQSAAQRLLEGRVYLGLMLDPSTPQIPPTSAPGVLHLAPRERSLPFRLLHAKVALLCFAEGEGGDWRLRLVVSTGNWTAATMDRSLDLIWVLELGRDHPAGPQRAQAVADILEAAAFFSRLREHFDKRVLTASEGPRARLTREDLAGFDAHISALRQEKAAPTSRFIHNERSPLLQVVPAVARTIGGSGRRNCLILGSGFYGSGSSGDLPDIPARLVRALSVPNADLLTQRPTIAIVVNPAACQEVAAAAPRIRREPGWRLLAAADPQGDTGGVRSLHAKFVFSAGWRTGGYTVGSWLYLGSGNLTAPGFATSAHAGGNLEAGVVFAPEVVRWTDLKRWLPVDVGAEDLQSGANDLSAGAPAPDRTLQFLAPPFAFLVHDEEKARLVPDVVASSARLILPGGARILAAPDGSYPLVGPCPAECAVAWMEGDAERQAVVPVIDAAGRVAGAVRGPLTFAELEDELGAFPDQPEVDLGEDDDGPPGDEGPGMEGTSAAAGLSLASVAPLRDLMHAIEIVAARQTRLHEGQWAAWCVRLEQALSRMKDQPMVTAARDLGVNPLDVLLRPEFRPSFCEHEDGEGAVAYRETLAHIASRWGVTDLPGLMEGA